MDAARLVAQREGRQWCLFVDRDGVVNRRIVGDYVRTLDQFEPLPGALDALATLSLWAPHLVVVTNQQGVAKGLVDPGELDRIHARLVAEVRSRGGRVDAVAVCPHHASEGCACRKPKPGLAVDWLASHPHVDGALSVVVGDSASDWEMSRRLSTVTGGAVAVAVGDEAGEADVRWASLSQGAHAIAEARKEP